MLAMDTAAITKQIVMEDDTDKSDVIRTDHFDRVCFHQLFFLQEQRVELLSTCLDHEEDHVHTIGM